MKYIVKSQKKYEVGYCVSGGLCGWLVLALYRCTPHCGVYNENGCVTAYCANFSFADQ